MGHRRAYQILERIDAAGDVSLYRAVRTADRRPVVLKVLQHVRARTRDLAQLQNELEIGRPLDSLAALKPLAIESYNGGTALIYEDFRGMSLQRLLGRPMAIDLFLRLSVRMAAALDEIHACGVIHKNIKPSSFLVTEGDLEIRIVDFGLAARLPRELQTLQPPRQLEGSLAYLSPEQTGRMNRVVDGRSDLYALGMTFYEMLVGRLPFEAHDPVEWVHSHLAQVPVPPSKRIPTIPSVLSDIVLRLLAKHAEDRYQSAAGLQRDLERCEADWRARGVIEPFPLAQEDAYDGFRIPQRLYGRDAHLASLHSAFARVRSSGRPEAVMVSGASGVGKTSLVHEMLRSVVEERGIFLEGKFDLQKQNVPYATVFEALGGIARELLSAREEELCAKQDQLRSALGGMAGLVTRALPQMELVLGPQPPIPDLPPEKSELRFHRTFARFIGALAVADQPIVLFLDDLQWADRASLRLLERVLTAPEAGHLLFIGGYRTTEVDAAHPLSGFLARLGEADVAVQDIELGPLSSRDLAALVVDTVHRPLEEARPLAALIEKKTGGNAFFVTHFLTELVKRSILTYDSALHGWCWDLDKVAALSHTDNVVDLMVSRLGRLPDETKRACMLAACVGGASDVALLAGLAECSEEALHGVLHVALSEGLLSRSDQRYRFAHDRVQQAAYLLIPPSDRPAIHLEIGRFLLAQSPPEGPDEHLFEVVNQINRGRDALPNAERAWAAGLNLRAGLLARKDVAYAAAAQYLDRGLELLPSDAWSTYYRLAFDLHLERARSAYLRGELDAADRRLGETLERAQTNTDAAAVYRAYIELETTRDRFERAVECGIAALALLGVSLSANPSWDEVKEAYEAVWARMGDREIEDLIDLPSMTDPTIRAAMDVLVALNSPALFTNLNCYYLVGCRLAELSILHGNSDASCAGYAIFAYLPGPGFGRYEEGSRFARLGYDLVRHRGLIGEEAKVLHDYGAVAFWTEPIRTAKRLVTRAFKQSVQDGDLTYACYSAALLTAMVLNDGEPLDRVEDAALRVRATAESAGFSMIEALSVGQRRFVDRLRGTVDPVINVGGETYDVYAFEARLRDDPEWTIAACWYFVYRTWADFVMGEIPSALRAAEEADARMWSTHSFPQKADHRFYQALALAAEAEDSAAIAKVAEHEAVFQVWASASPTTFGARHTLLRAELARVQRREIDAIDGYELAIRRSAELGYVHTEALASELAARFYLSRGQQEVGYVYLRRARACYARWGARAKVGQLDRRYPDLVAPAVTETPSLAVPVEQLDLMTVVEASQAISRELVLDALVQTLLRLITGLAGAQRGALVLVREGELRLEASALLTAEGVATKRLPSIPVERSREVPASIITYAWRARERVVLDDALRAERFRSDPYVARERPRTVLSVPVVRNEEVVGLIYLENRASAEVWAPRSLAAVEVLAAQAAISLENALLIEREQARRTEAEAEAKRTAFLGEATVLLGSSLDYERVLTDFCRLCVRRLADWCIIDLADDGELGRRTGAHADPAREPQLRKLRAAYPLTADALVPAATVFRTGEPLLIPHLTPAMIRARCVDDEHARLVTDLGTRSVLAVPITVRNRKLGVLTLVSSDAELDQSDLRLVQELGLRAGIAIDNARLYCDAQRAICLRDEFLSIASHELRTPLTALQLTIQAARAPGTLDPERTADLFERLARQATRLTRLVDALLEVTRLESGTFELAVEEVDLVALARTVADDLSFDLARLHTELRLHADRPVVGRWDPLRIEQALINLLSNAIKFGQGQPIDVRVEATERGAVFTVHDRGIGIAAEVRPLLFHRFSRGVSARHYGGLGLGLYISRTIVEAHGGTIDVESAPGEGTTFTITLPFEPSAETSPTPRPGG